MKLSKGLVGLLGLAAVAAAAGCTYTGGVEDPLTRRFTWFSYVRAEDVENKCRPGLPRRYRLIFNADWQQQVRTYDLRESIVPNGGAMLYSTVFGNYGVIGSSFSLSDPFATSRGATAEVQIPPDTYRAILQAIDDSSFGEPAPKGLRLDSWDFYWIVASCIDGRFHFNAWRYPSARFDQIKFDKWLFALDGTGVPPNPPRALDRAEQNYLSQPPRQTTYGGTPYAFELIVGDNGLDGHLPGLSF